MWRRGMAPNIHLKLKYFQFFDAPISIQQHPKKQHQSNQFIGDIYWGPQSILKE